MKKIGFAAISLLFGMISSSSFAQNYYDPGFYQNNRQNYGYANYYAANNAYNQNHGYYPQQTPQPQAAPKYKQTEKNMPQNQQRSRRYHGVGTISVGADYVLGYSKFNDTDYDLGHDLGIYKFDTNDFDKKSDAISLNIGWRPFKHIGIEAYYLSSSKSSKKDTFFSTSFDDEYLSSTFEQEISYKSYGLDIIGYYPINDYIELLASIGVGKYDFEGDVTILPDIHLSTSLRDNVCSGSTLCNTVSKTMKDSVTAYRIGGGFQLWLSKHLALRTTGRWTSLGGNFADYITEISFGLRYHF